MSFRLHDVSAPPLLLVAQIIVLSLPSGGWAQSEAPVFGRRHDLKSPTQQQAEFFGCLERMGQTLATAVVRVDVAELLAGSRFDIDLPGGQVLRFERTRHPSRSPYSIWKGIEPRTGSSILLAARGEDAAGTIRSGGRRIAVRPLGSGLHALIEWDPLAPGEEGDRDGSEKRLQPHSAPPPTEHAFPCCPEIGLLVAYTKAAQSCAGATLTAVELVAAAAVELANATFVNSGVNLSLDLQHMFKAEGFTECCQTPGSSCHGIEADCSLLREANDNTLDEVHTLRDVYAADIVVLLTGYRSWCAGKAFTTGADASEAFAVINHMWAVDDIELAHEIGHLFGARHAKDASTAPFPYGHGACGDDGWRTVMALPSECGSQNPRIPYWSNPEKTVQVAGYHPAPLGSVDFADNARVLRESACTVASFRVPGTLALSPSSLAVRRGRAKSIAIVVSRSGVPVGGAPLRAVVRDEVVAGVQEWSSTNEGGHCVLTVDARAEGETAIEVYSEGAASTVKVEVTPAWPWWLQGTGAALVLLGGAAAFVVMARRRR